MGGMLSPMIIADKCQIRDFLSQRNVHVVDGFVDLLRALEAHGGAIDSGVLEGEAHRGLAVFVPNVRGSTGYGLDYAEKYRNLDDICVLDGEPATG